MDLLFSRMSQLAFGNWHAQALFSLVGLGVCELLGDDALTAESICARCGLDRLAGEGLLNAGVALSLLKKEAGLFRNSETARRFLVSSSPESLVHWVRVMGRWAGPWTQLSDVVHTGRPAESQASRLGGDPAYLEDFILGMHEYARRSSRAVAEAMALNGVQHLADVGGGAGTYSIALCGLHSQLRPVILDLQPVLAITRSVIESQGLETRISTQVCDYLKDPFGEEVDAVLLSNVLHQEAPATVIDMLTRARAALLPEGLVIVHGHFLNEDRCGPVFSTLHNLSAFALWNGGRSYTTGDMTNLMLEAGVREVRVIPVPDSATTLLIGRSTGLARG